ncbi:hypothetical protein E3O06_14485 [Cryobacterium glaciale]|uniref:Uncharacterized protein n=1 Tax=Cryobacterium glaciale TaxID=1259145 RepID=A0A4R8UTT2_9MICO|nr:hypothetical protein [Cryobacterium glaciale]TFB70655.1 hypothetical protein E3O06_14485 [Cryobacterium glaciale]
MEEDARHRAELKATADRMGKRVDRMKQGNATLRSRLDKNSTIISKPLNTDSFSRPASKARSFQEAAGKPQSRHAGSGGASLPMTATPDRVFSQEPRHCRGYGNSLRGIAGIIAATQKVIDVQPIQVETDEHQRIEEQCLCDIVTAGVSPTDVT